MKPAISLGFYCFLGFSLHTVGMRIYPILLLALLMSPSAYAQVDVPRNVEAGSIDEQVKLRPVPKASTSVAKDYTPIIVPQGADKVYFTLGAINIEGMKAFDPKEFTPLYKNKIGKKINLTEIYAIADWIKRAYHEDGYVLTQVYLPEQSISGGKVLIQVNEGFISRLRWDGEEVKDKLILKMAEKIKRARPFSSKQLEDVMLRLNELPGVTATSALEPIPAKEAEVGGVGLAITVSRKRISGSVSVDNYASRHLGVIQSTARAEGYGILSPLDKISFTGSSSADPARLRYGALQYNIPVHQSGTTVFFGGSLSATHPGYRLSALDIFSSSESLNIGVSQPIWRSREQSLDMGLQFAMKNQQTDVFDAAFSEDRLRMFILSGTYNIADSWRGSNIISVDVAQGLNILDATKTGSPALSRTSGHSDFTHVSVNASRLQGITEDFSMLLAVTGQKTSATLLSSEQFGFGGQQFGRGYDSSEISGDEGVAASAELRWQAMQGVLAMQPFVFYDIGVVKDKQPSAQSISAASAGFGSRFQWDKLYLDTNIAVPLTFTPATPKLGAEDKDPRLNVSMGVRF
jgi:hemolysin activation/secretion protein